MRYFRTRIALGLAVFVTAGTSAPPPCASAEYRQFDFWAGDWDAYDVADMSKIVARNHVSIILGGCVVHESYQQNDGLNGESYSIYDASRQQWHQSWVTDRGTLLLLDGGMKGNQMVLTATERAADGSVSFLRGVWFVEGAGVRETATRSVDGGKSWKPVFDMRFLPHGQPAR